MNHYRKNMAALTRTAPEVIRWLEQSPKGDGAEIVLTPSGHHNLRMIDGNGEPFLVYDGPDPEASEREAVRRLPAVKGKGTFLFGLGLGYRASILTEDPPPEHVLFLVEEKPSVIKLALRTVDLSQRISDHTLMFVSPENGLLDKLVFQVSRMYRKGELQLMTDERCWRYFSAAFKEDVARFTQAVVKQAQNESAYYYYAQNLLDNTLTNLVPTLLSPDVSNLKDSLKGVPAVVVSAGPSLAESLPRLADASGRAALVATAPVLRVLQAHDIIPDLVGVMDFTPGNYQVLTDAYATEDAPLVFLEAVMPDVVREYQGDLFSVLQSGGTVRAWLGRHLEGRDHWKVGCNVGGFCLDLALYLGADPIILVGQDLSFPGNVMHCEGVAGTKVWTPGQGTAQTVWLDSVAGGKVQSNLTFASYLESFNRTIAEHPDRTFINTSLQGARIKGTVEMPLSEAMAVHGAMEHDITPAVRRALTAGPRLDAPGLLTELTDLDSELAALSVVTGKAVEFCDEILDLIDHGAGPSHERLRHLIKTHAEYRAGVDKYWRVFEPLKQYLSLILDEYFEKAAASGTDWLKSTRHSVELNRSFMTAACEGAGHLQGRLRAERDKLAALVTAAPGEDPNSLDFQLKLARNWAGLGRLKTAWDYYRRALALDPDNQDLLLETARVGLKRERLRAAYELVRRILDRAPRWDAALALEKEILDTAGGWQKRAEEALATEDWVTALLVARKLLAFDPAQPGYRSLETRALDYRKQRETLALESQNSRIRQKQILDLTARAEKAFDENRFEELVAVLAGRLDPEDERDHRALVLLGAGLLALGREGEAMAVLQDMARRRPQWAYLPAKLGLVLVKGGRVEAGVDLLEQAGRNGGSFRHLLFDAGCLRMKTGQYQRAIEDFEQHLAAYPSSYETLNKLAICLLALGRPKSARLYFEKTLTIQPHSEAAKKGLEMCDQREQKDTASETA